MIFEILKTTAAGAAIGALFVLLRLPVPAPPVFSAVMGIVGLWLGAVVMGKFI
jgi:XapX domain-containing protein